MRAVVLDMPQAWLDERHRLDLDRKDEMWEGMLHVVPPASSDQSRLGAHLMAFLLWGFYRRVGVEELLYVDPGTRAFEVRRPDGDGWTVVAADEDGWVGLHSLGVWLRKGDGRLHVRTGERTVEL